MKKWSLFILFSILTISVKSQFLWYQNETEVSDIIFDGALSGVFSTNIDNPNTAGINPNSQVSKYIRNAGASSGFTNFNLNNPIDGTSDYSITVKAYIDLSETELGSGPTRFRVFLESTTTGDIIYSQLNFSEGQKWSEFNFDFESSDFSQETIDAGGYDRIRIGYGSGQSFDSEIVYYIDDIYGTTNQESITNDLGTVEALRGSWGITFPVFGGERLDEEVASGYKLVEGAEEIVAELPTANHVITNLSYFAHSHYFTLSKNSYVDVANEIHPSIVPSEANDEIIFDVLKTFKDSGKKIILYISTNYFERADEEVQLAWEAYYTNNFNGDEYLAYENLCKGFIEQVKEYADGYWLDTVSKLDDDDKLGDFITMIKSVDPDAFVTANQGKKYLTINGETAYVDTDGLEDEDETDYKIIIHEPLNTYQDFTHGHVTPIGQGAPVNSWGYDEFTIPNMVENPTYVINGKTVLKHAWFPVRERWHSPYLDLYFDVEQSYRFVKSITDAGASITFANTTDYGKWNAGYMMQDEMDMMKEINDRLLSLSEVDYEPYIRPEGAFLVGEVVTGGLETVVSTDISIYPNPSSDIVHVANAKNTQLKVYNNYNQLIITEFVTTDDFEVDISDYTQGVYSIIITDDVVSTVHRIVKND